MISIIPISWLLIASTVLVHCMGLAVILWILLKLASVEMGIIKTAWRLNSLVWWIIVLHMIEILIWGLFYWWQECFSNFEIAFYFSAVTYTTIGYGDILLPVEWRMLAPIQGLTGILLCGLSAAVFFAVVSYLHKMNMEIDND
ncbi:MAG: hypothetical protein ACI8PB_004666 [Desulforhopalus sp.]|jgi:hypothetical protein